MESQPSNSIANTSCVASIVAHFEDSVAVPSSKEGPLSSFRVISLGVGTKFLPRKLLEEGTHQDGGIPYGTRLRDCHAEVLARRAFQRYLWHEIMTSRRSDINSNIDDITNLKILQRIDNLKFRLKDGVSLHFYSSSSPCGNATVKKFAKMRKEKFDRSYDDHHWPTSNHEKIESHSIKLGQFALLLKRDRTFDAHDCGDSAYSGFEEPSGTSLDVGVMHCCSDKLCRWNCLGLQGSLLSIFFEMPIYMQSFICGRKFTHSICRRAVCCRAIEFEKKRTTQYTLNHPSIMGTSEYLNENSVINMDKASYGTNANFGHLCWIMCNSFVSGSQRGVTECVDGNTGFVIERKIGCNSFGVNSVMNKISAFSTFSIAQLYCEVLFLFDAELAEKLKSGYDIGNLNLYALIALKANKSKQYENEKQKLLKTRTFQKWKGRKKFLTETR